MARNRKKKASPELKPVERKTFLADVQGLNEQQEKIAEDTGSLREAVKHCVELRGYEKTAFGLARRIMRMSPEKFADFARSFDDMWPIIMEARTLDRIDLLDTIVPMGRNPN